MSAERDYWSEYIAIAAEECGLTLTAEQLAALASAAESGHDHYGMAFYSPPWSERVDEIEREYKKKLSAQQAEHERYVTNAETAIKRALRVHRDDAVSIEANGDVIRHGGRSERIL